MVVVVVVVSEPALAPELRRYLEVERYLKTKEVLKSLEWIQLVCRRAFTTAKRGEKSAK
jgi:hypothetical protein